MSFNFFKIFCLVFFFHSCQNAVEIKKATDFKRNKNGGVKYAKRFAISEQGQYLIVYIFGNRNTSDTTTTFVLLRDSSLKNLPKANYTIKIPCKKVAALSSIYATIFYELGVLETLAAIDNIDYVNNKAIIEKHKRGQLKELAKMPQIDLEQTVVLSPDIIFTFGMGDGAKDLDKKLQQSRMPVAVSIDHLEESPLARAEWIKFFAAFVDKKELADSIFDGVEKNYNELKKIASSVINRPTVFNEIKYSDSWYMPGGKSFMAQLLNDAGADYLWKGDYSPGSLPLSFEQVYAKAKDADFWINLSAVNTKNELLAFESRYAEFSAFKKGNLYNNTKVTNDKGYSIYWETGMIYPNRILNDLICIFHPELNQSLNKQLYYYRRVE